MQIRQADAATHGAPISHGRNLVGTRCRDCLDTELVNEILDLPLLGVSVTPLNAGAVAEAIRTAVTDRRRLWIANYNFHAVYLSHVDPEFNSYSRNADLRLIDGWPVLAVAKTRSSSVQSSHRIGSTDWLSALVQSSPKLSILAVGGTTNSCIDASRHFNSIDGVRWEGVDGFEFRHRPISGDARKLSHLINEADLVLVGLGMPEQEHWIVQNANLLRGKVVANVGGCIDYFSGAQSLAPRFLGRYGAEWLYRLLRNPRRLWYRYTAEPVYLVAMLGWRFLRSKFVARGREMS